MASSVIIAHAPELIDGNRSREPAARLFGDWVSLGDLAVEGFFLVSGYLIAESWLRQPRLLPYLWRRFLRIYPAFIVAMLVTAFGFGAICTNPDYWAEFNLKGFLKGMIRLRVLILPAGFPDLPNPFLNGPPWTIVYEWSCYLMVAVLGMLRLLSRRWVMLVLALATTAWASAQIGGWVSPIPPFRLIAQSDADIPRLLCCFLAGSTFAAFGDWVRWDRWGVLGAGIVWFAAMFYPPAGMVAIPWAGGYLLFAAAFGPLVPRTGAIRREDISYGLYLYAWPIAQIIISRWHQINPWLLAVLTFGPAATLGWVSWRVVEKPILRLKRLI